MEIKTIQAVLIATCVSACGGADEGGNSAIETDRESAQGGMRPITEETVVGIKPLSWHDTAL